MLVAVTAATERRVLVTGASGKLGRVVVAELARPGSGLTPVAVDREAPAGGDLDGVPVRTLELTDQAAVREAVAGCDAVIHLAAYPRPGIVPDATLFANNTQATYQVLEVAAAGGVGTVVLASSASAYGMTYARRPFSPRYVPIDEDHPLLAQDAYALSKVVDEATAQRFARGFGLAAVALRFHLVAWPGQVADLVARLAADPGPEARNLWGYVEVHDAARACVAALRVKEGFHAVNVCAADTLCAAPTAELLARYHPSTEVREPIVGTASAWSTARARDLLGFAPRWSWRSSSPRR